ncbi:hypothetical protein DFP72DRAFT_1168241 [Ephemerocybe angulata]|uniref:Uncharacterized protein n=1 Tax=Ephemerocybe angulata TaxID=980116 RepID=A0A8H6I4Y8_9AGAR|nr:hypothetical protein DFP72DRAFT_1168241 [Tulosesus angulatus]
MTTHPTQSLPSFAQAFSNHSLSTISAANNALPPIHARNQPMDKREPPARPLSRPPSDDDVARTAGRKRPHTDTRDDGPPDAEYPRLAKRCSGQGRKMIKICSMRRPRHKDPPSDHRNPPQDAQGAPPPSSTMPSPMKRRRMTVTGAPHALNIDVRVPQPEANSTPISPVVMGFTIQRDNPKEIEQVKSMITVKQKQKLLIEQRRGSLAAPAPSNSAPTQPQQASEACRERESTRRVPTSSGVNRAPSPNVSTFQMQQSMQLPHQSAQTLPPPPISFAKRRAAQLGTKRKPADIVINPRERESPEQFQPSIQSAPPTQGAFYSGRHTMALPRLPNVMGAGAESSIARRPAGNVPPTPTRLSQRMNNAPAIHVEGARSPMPSIPIASSLVPPTPAFHQTEHSGGDKAAFLAPFALFYESLNDAKQLKTWLGDQLQRSNSLFQNLSQQQDRIQDTVESIVERKLSAVHSEMAGLRRRVLELEDALRDAQQGRRGSVDVGPLYHTKSLQNGYSSSSSHLPPDPYTFPPTSSDHSRLRSDLSGRVSSPRGHERDGRGMHEYERDSSVPYDSRRSTASALRLEPPRSHLDHSSLPPPPPHSRHSLQSPPQMYRDSPPNHHSLPPPPPLGSHSKSSRGGLERPPLPETAFPWGISGSRS